MSTREEIRGDAKRDAYQDDGPDPCECGMRQWSLAQTDDADGRRGVPLRLWECRNCGREQEVLS